jgi:hypothetical protein
MIGTLRLVIAIGIKAHKAKDRRRAGKSRDGTKARSDQTKGFELPEPAHFKALVKISA